MTDFNETFKISFSQQLDKLNLNGSYSTGLRNPTLYELYGTDANYGIKGNASIDPEKSKTNELTLKYDHSKNVFFKSTFYKIQFLTELESNAEYSKHENMKTDINQRGLESTISLKKIIKLFLSIIISLKAEKIMVKHKTGRPDLSFGANYFAKIENSPIEINL